MSCRLSLLLGMCAVSLASLVGCGPEPGETARQGLPLGEAMTNGQFTVRRDGLKKLEDDLNRTFQSITPQGSLDPLTAPAPPPPQVSRTPVLSTKKPQDRKKWLLDNADELGSSTAPTDDFFKIPGYDSGDRDRAKKPDPRLERFYKSLNENSRTAKSDPMSQQDPLDPDKKSQTSEFSQKEEDAKAPGAVRDSESRLRRLLGLESDPSSATAEGAKTLSEFLEGSQAGGEQALMDKNSLDQYRQLLNSALPAPITPSPFNPLSANSSKAPVSPLTPPGLDTYASSTREKTLGQLSTLNPTLTPVAPQDPTARVLNDWNPLYTPARVEPPKPAATPFPSFDAPRRRF